MNSPIHLLLSLQSNEGGPELRSSRPSGLANPECHAAVGCLLGIDDVVDLDTALAETPDQILVSLDGSLDVLNPRIGARLSGVRTFPYWRRLMA